MGALRRGKLGCAVSGLWVCLAALALAAPAHAASGTWERTWGMDVDVIGVTGFEVCTVAASCQAGLIGVQGGELSTPEGVAADGAGNVYVSDLSNKRIQKFDSAGNFQRAWGKDVVTGGGTGFEVCTAAASCQAGSTGGLGGELSSPAGVAADAAGNVYVADISNSRIQKFDSAGNFQRAWGKDVDTGGGTDFEVCTVAASCKAGSPLGGLGGELVSPDGVAADAAGSVYVADFSFSNSRIQKFDSAGNFQRAWGKDVVTGGGTGFEVCTAAASCKAGAEGGLGGELMSPSGVGVDVAGNVYVSDQFNHRIQKFDSAGNFQRAWGKDVDTGGGTGFEICTAPASCKAGLIGGLGGELNFPEGVAADAAGNVYVSDLSNQRIQKFDSAGNFQRAWGKDVDVGGGTGFEICTVAASCKIGSFATALGGELRTPQDVAADGAGNVYVGDGNSRIQKFAADPAPSPPPSDGGGTTPPSNEFTIGKLKGKKLTLTVPGAGEVEVTDAADQSARRASAAAKKKLLKPSSATASGAGTVTVKLKLTRTAKQKLKQRGKVKVNAAITFTPTGGPANTENAKLKLKK